MPQPLNRRKMDTLSIVKEAGCVLEPVWTGAENFASTKFDPRTIQPVANRYTDFDMPAHIFVCIFSAHLGFARLMQCLDRLRLAQSEGYPTRCPHLTFPFFLSHRIPPCCSLCLFQRLERPVSPSTLVLFVCWTDATLLSVVSCVVLDALLRTSLFLLSLQDLQFLSASLCPDSVILHLVSCPWHSIHTLCCHVDNNYKWVRFRLGFSAGNFLPCGQSNRTQSMSLVAHLQILVSPVYVMSCVRLYNFKFSKHTRMPSDSPFYTPGIVSRPSHKKTCCMLEGLICYAW